MFTVFEVETLFVFLFVSLFWLLGYLYVRKLEVGLDKKFELSMRNVAAISVFLITYNIFISIRYNERIEKNRTSYNTLQNIQRNWLEPQHELLQQYPEGYFLYISITPDAHFTQAPPTTFDPAKREQLEIYYSIRIFQAVEDFLSSGTYDYTGKYVWINNYLMWMQSPILRKHWKNLSFNYSEDTRELIDRIISKSDELIALRKKKGRLTVADYDAISKSFPVDFR